MEILIRHVNLIDFPYDPKRPEYHALFRFDEQKVDNLVSEILLASPTCYLVSGYRGSGKTSFIKRVQEKCQELADKEGYGHTGILFVYSSFSRFENKTYFLRKIIRDLRNSVRLNDRNEKGWEDLDRLVEKTLHDRKEEKSLAKEEERSLDVNLDPKKFLSGFIKAAAPFFIPYVADVLTSPLWKDITWTSLPLIKVAIASALIIWGIVRAINFTVKYNIKEIKSDKTTTTSISDDEITEYDLEAVLDRLALEKWKVVFVLDELDKVDDLELDQLLKEMKPWLVRGKADFILVAGQRLSMKYYNLKERDDELLSSLFSKIIHIGPLTEQYLETIFNDLLVVGTAKATVAGITKPHAPLTQVMRKMCISACTSFIYRSRRLPRTFMNLVRQELNWTNNESFLLVSEQANPTMEIKMKILRRMQESLALNGDVAETVRSHLSMQLFRAASLISDKVIKKLSFEELFAYIINPENKKETRSDYPYMEVFPLLRICIEDFYAQAISEGILESPPSPKKDQDLGRENSIEVASGINVPSMDTARIDNFKLDFNSFISILNQMTEVLELSERIDTKELRVDHLISVFRNNGYFQMPDPVVNSLLLQNNSSYYHSGIAGNIVFSHLSELFIKENINFNEIFRQLFSKFADRKLRKTFLSIDIQPGYNLSVDYLLPISGTSRNYDVLIDCRYVNGAPSVSVEETDRAVSILEEYNLGSSRGNYYLMILFYKTYSGVNRESISLSANYQVEKIRPALAGRIRYIVLSVFDFKTLDKELAALFDFKPYSLAPVLNIKGKRSTLRIPLKKISPEVIIYPDDPQKGKWGGQSVSNEREITAKVIKDDSKEDWYNVRLKVMSTSENNPLIGKVTFYLHDSFSPNKYTVLAKNGIAEINDLYSYEAFTVGVSCDNNTTKLELDLNKLPDAPDGFKYDE